MVPSTPSTSAGERRVRDENIKTVYDLELHPLVAEEFAPSLATSG